MSQAKDYTVNSGFDLAAFSESVKAYMEYTLKLETQILTECQLSIIQGKEKNSFKKYIGMNKAVIVKSDLSEGVLSIEVGQGKWIDKAAGAAVGMLVFWPALITASIGAYQQMHLPKQVLEFIEEYLSNYQDQPITVKCQACGNLLHAEDVFCRKCGAKN